MTKQYQLKNQRSELFNGKIVGEKDAYIIALKELCLKRAMYAEKLSREDIFKLGLIYELIPNVINYLSKKSKGLKLNEIDEKIEINIEKFNKLTKVDLNENNYEATIKSIIMYDPDIRCMIVEIKQTA